MPQLFNRVKCAVPNPGTVDVGSTITLGAAPNGFRSFLTAAGSGGVEAYFTLSNGADRTIRGIWTVNATTPETATIVEIISNDRTNTKAGETFSGACVAWSWLPAEETLILRDGPLAGFRNLIVNGNPVINQRGYLAGTPTTGANQYTLDRWRVVTSGQAASWTDSGGVRSVTAPAGGMEQIVEGANILAGIYTLSWKGAATATVNGSPVANGGQITLPGSTNATVRMSGASWSLLQLEPGPKKTPFEMRPRGIEQMLCQRYYQTLGRPMPLRATLNAGAGSYWPITFVPTMRAGPTAIPGWNNANGLATSYAVNRITPAGATAELNSSGGDTFVTLEVCIFDAEL